MSRAPRVLLSDIADLRVALFELDNLVKDMLSPPHKRAFGPVLHREQYAALRANIARFVGFIPSLSDSKRRLSLSKRGRH